MRLLEDSLGHQLFDRIGKKLSLNERGLRFLSRAQRLIDQFDELISSSDDDDDPVGAIYAEAITSCMSLLVKATLQARERYPRFTIRPAVG
jgi:DNA-binding transcriptional LysR family regulator